MKDFFTYLLGVTFGANGVLTFLDWNYPPANAQIHHYHQIANWIWLAVMLGYTVHQWRNRPAAIAERAKREAVIAHG